MGSVYFDPAVGGDGSTVTDDANATTGLANGGHRIRFVPALSQVVAIAQDAASNAAASAASAENSLASAVLALNSPGTQATSTTSLAVGLGSKSLTLAQTGKAFVVGQYVEIVNSTTAWMVGLITAFTPGTGAMTVNVTNTGGSGTLASWTISPTTPPELPPQSGNAGKYLKTDGSTSSWVGPTLARSTCTSNTNLVAADSEKLIDITSGTFTQTFDAAATLGSGWYCYIRNSGVGDITLDPSGSETIDGLSSFVMYPGETRLVQCDGAGFASIVINAFSRELTSSGYFIKPPGYKNFKVDLYGAGGGGGGGRRGAASSTRDGGSGGGGGGFWSCTFTSADLTSTVAVTIGAGGAGGASASADSTSFPGSNGGTSSFGSYFSVNGGGGGQVGIGGSSGGAGGYIVPALNNSNSNYYLVSTGYSTSTGLGPGVGGFTFSGQAGGYGGGAGSGNQGDAAATNTAGGSYFGGAGGGHGGAIAVNNFGRNASAGANIPGAVGGAAGSNSTAQSSASATTSGTNGASGVFRTGGGGGGCGGGVSGTGGNGGNGGIAGGGGGGGGSTNGNASGAGGNGGAGFCKIYGVI